MKKILVALVATLACACTQTPPEMKVVNDAAAALGGRDKILAVKTLTIEGGSDAVAPGAAITFQTIRLVLSISGALVVLVCMAKALRIPEFDAMIALAEVRVRKLLGYESC